MGIQSLVNSALEGLHVTETDIKPIPGYCGCDTGWGL